MRNVLALGLLLSFCAPSNASAASLTSAQTRRIRGRIRGAALIGDAAFFTWGDELRLWSLPGLQSRLLARGRFTEGGCAVDLDGDGQSEFVGAEGEGLGKLTWRRPPNWTPEVIDSEIEMHDCIEADLFGRRGVLMIQRYMQVRFYERPKQPKEPWKVREIYSIYTPSQQAGLALHDVDHDGHPDIYCGNYWIRSPTAFELPWRLFAIDTYSEYPLSAMLRLSKSGEDLAVSQSHLEAGRVTWFEKPADPKQMWIDHRLTDSAIKPHGLMTMDLDADRKDDVLVGEQNGNQSRLTIFWNDGAYRFHREDILAGADVIGLWKIRGDAPILAVEAGSVSLWKWKR